MSQGDWEERERDRDREMNGIDRDILRERKKGTQIDRHNDRQIKTS